MSSFGYDYMLLFKRINSAVFIKAYELITLSYITFAVLFFFILKRKSTASYFTPVQVTAKYNGLKKIFVFILLALIFLCSWLMYYLKLAIPGEAVILPFKIAGFIYYFSTMFIPLLILVWVYLSDMAFDKFYSAIYCAILSLNGLLLFVVTGSKMSLIAPAIFLILLWLITDKLTKQRQKYIAIIVVLFIFVYPFLNKYRSVLRIHSQKMPAQIFQTYWQELEPEDDSFISTELHGLALILNRITGTSSLILVLNSDPPFDLDRMIDLVLGGEAINYLFTVDIMGYKEGGEKIVGTSVAASLLGQAFFITGSYILTTLLFGAWIIIVNSVFKKIHELRGKGRPVIMLIAIVNLFAITIDGISLYQLFIFAMALACVAVITNKTVALVAKESHRTGIYGERSISEI